MVAGVVFIASRLLLIFEIVKWGAGGRCHCPHGTEAVLQYFSLSSLRVGKCNKVGIRVTEQDLVTKRPETRSPNGGIAVYRRHTEIVNCYDSEFHEEEYNTPLDGPAA